MAPTWQKTATLVIPAASVGFGFFVFIFSCIYCFGAVGLQTTTMMDKLKDCRDDSGTSISFTVKCSFQMNEMAAGVIGFLFGLIQIGTGVGMYIKKEKQELYKVWAVANIVLLLFILTAAVLPLHVYTAYPDCGEGGGYPPGGGHGRAKSSGGKQYQYRSECTLQGNYILGKPVCFYHVGCNQLAITDGNGVVLCYGILGVLDSIFIFASVVALAMMHQAASESPSGYYPPSSAGSVEPMASNQSQTASVSQMSQALNQPPAPNMSRMAKS